MPNQRDIYSYLGDSASPMAAMYLKERDMQTADREKIQEAIERHLVSLRDELESLGVKDHMHYILGPNPDATYLKNGVLAT